MSSVAEDTSARLSVSPLDNVSVPRSRLFYKQIQKQVILQFTSEEDCTLISSKCTQT